MATTGLTARGVHTAVILRRLISPAVILCLSACATIHDYIVDYHYRGSSPVDLASSHQRLHVGEVVDRRGVEPLMIFQVDDSGARAEKPVTAIIQNALVQGLTAAKAPVVDSGATRTISGQLFSYVTHGMTQGWTGVLTEDKMSLGLMVSDTATGGVCWRDTLLIASSATSHGGPMADKILRNSLDELINRLLKEEEFLRCLH